MEYYNGKKESVLRHYNSLKRFVGENRIYPCGDVLCVSVRNNGDYQLFITADGKHRFIELYYAATHPDKPIHDGEIGSEEIKDGSIRLVDLSDEVRKGLDELNNINISDEDMEKWFDDDSTNDDPEE